MEIDVLDPRFYDDPWEAYRWLRNEAPIHRDDANELWVLSKHEDVSHVSRHQERYSAAQGVRPKVRGADVDHLDGRPRAHPPAPARQQGLHPGEGARAVRAHAGAHQRDHRRDRGEGRVRLRRGLRHPRAAHHHRRADGARPRPARPPLPVERRHDGRRRPPRPRRARSCSPAAEAFGEFCGMCLELIEQAHGARPRRPTSSDPHQRQGARAPSSLGGMAEGQELLDELSSDELLLFLDAARRRRQRDDPQRHHRRAARLLAVPRRRRRSCSPTPTSSTCAVDEIVRYVSPVHRRSTAPSPRPTTTRARPSPPATRC